MAEIIVEFPSPLTEKEKKMIYGYKGELTRCKDCKHRPLTGSEAPLLDDAEASFKGERDYKCPCLCYDSYYSLTPKEDFFCGFGERRE